MRFPPIRYNVISWQIVTHNHWSNLKVYPHRVYMYFFTLQLSKISVMLEILIGMEY